MTTSESRSVSTLWLLVAVACAAIAACSDGPPSTTAGPLGRGVYIGAPWQRARGMPGHQIHVVEERIPCVKCHELGADSIGDVTPARCAACHEKEARLEHASARAKARFGSEAKTDCTDCHAFDTEGTGHVPIAGEMPEIHRPSDCARCHSLRQGNTPAMVVHGTSECVTCHAPHETERPEPGDCADCHLDVKTTHAGHGKTTIAVCTTCHQHQHAPAADARATCAECHRNQDPVVPATALFEGHQECIGCHRPHQFETKQAVSCRSCHEHVHALAERRVAAHARCESCHAPHDVRASTAQACASCHEAVHSDHPTRGAAGSCTGCHDPHPAAGHAHASAQKCSACHQIAASEKEFHGGTECKQCHRPHRFLAAAADRTTCQGCHAQQIARVATLAGHQSCESCHRGLPHRPAALSAGCDSCHAAVQHAANPGHQQCTHCHEPHGGAIGSECRSCHVREHLSAPAGHKQCTSCHQPHSGSSAKAPCSSCHAEQAATAHGRLAHDCAGCHRPHGPDGVPSPPACGSCHRPENLSGLHSVDRHRDCARCHTGHGEPPNAARGACLACHTDRKDHFPDAPRCASCHLFTKTR